MTWGENTLRQLLFGPLLLTGGVEKGEICRCVQFLHHTLVKTTLVLCSLYNTLFYYIISK